MPGFDFGTALIPGGNITDNLPPKGGIVCDGRHGTAQVSRRHPRLGHAGATDLILA